MTYGLGCAFTCSRCRNGTPCHHEDGTCLQGCDEGLYGGTCKSGMYTFIFFPNKNKKNPMELAYFWSFLLSIFPVVLRLRVFQVYCPILCLLPFGHSHSYSTGITLT